MIKEVLLEEVSHAWAVRGIFPILEHRGERDDYASCSFLAVTNGKDFLRNVLQNIYALDYK